MSFHKCSYNGGARVMLSLDSRFPETVPVYAFINYFALSDAEAFPDPRMLQGEDVQRIFALVLSRAFRARGVRKVPLPPDAKWDAMLCENEIVPNQTGSPRDFTRPEEEVLVDFLLFYACQLLDIKLCHGWILNPEDPDDIGDRQLTRHGLERLTNEIEEGQLALLFRSSCIYVIHKHKGSLYVLETGKGTLNKRPGSMWKTLTVLQHEEIFFTSAFTPIGLSSQPNSQVESVAAYVNQWNAEVHRTFSSLIEEIEGQVINKSKKAKGKKKTEPKLVNVQNDGSTSVNNKSGDKVDGVHDNCSTSVEKKTGDKIGGVHDPSNNSVNTKSGDEIDGVHDHDSTSVNKKNGDKIGGAHDPSNISESKKPTTGEIPEASSAGGMDDLDEYTWAKKAFKEFLEKFVDKADDAPEEMPFYVRMVQGWKRVKPKHIPYSAIICYHHVELYDRILALAILNNRTRLHEVLSQVFLDFRVKQECGTKKELKGKVKIRVVGMPPAGSTCRFEDFLNSSNAKMAEPHTLFDGTILNSTTYIGRRAGKGYVDDIIDKHLRGESWNGNFSESDLGIKDGRFQILTPATKDVSLSSISADFVTLTVLLFKHYKTDISDQAPAYFHVFQNEVLNMEQNFADINSPEFKVFQRYLSHHLAFKAPRVRATLFIDIWGDIQSLRRIIGPNNKRAPFTRLQNVCLEKFHTKFIKDWYFKYVYAYDNFIDGDKYASREHARLLELIRHLEVHPHDHTRDINGDQLLTDAMHVDLMIEKTLNDYVSELVYTMMLELNDSPFSSSWEHYEMSDCGNDLQNTAFDGREEDEKEQSRGMGSYTSETGEAKIGVETSGPGSGEPKGSAKETGDVVNEEQHE